MRLVTLKRSPEFRRIRGGGRFSTEAFLLECKRRPEPPDERAADGGGQSAGGRPASNRPSGTPTAGTPTAGTGAGGTAPPSTARFGFTVTRKLGGAVVRNRIRRRLKAAVRALDADAPRPDHDYVIVARARAVDQPFSQLSADMARAVRKAGEAAVKAAAAKTSASRPAAAAGAAEPPDGGSARQSSRPPGRRAVIPRTSDPTNT